jgi:hypothetical protein
MFDVHSNCSFEGLEADGFFPANFAATVGFVQSQKLAGFDQPVNGSQSTKVNKLRSHVRVMYRVLSGPTSCNDHDLYLKIRAGISAAPLRLSNPFALGSQKKAGMHR